MYRINSSLQYVYHYASTKEVAEAVRDDLMSREDCKHPEVISIENYEDKPAYWDPGGSVCISDNRYTFNLMGMDVELYRQHIPYLTIWINKSKLIDWHGIKYYKIYSGYLHCLCLTPIEFEQLKKQLHSQECIREGLIGSELKQNASEVSGFTQTAKTKDDNGKEIIVRIKRKTPTLN